MGGHMRRPLVTAIVSTFDAERLFAGCMENLLRQSLYARGLLEIVVVDSGSRQGESALAAAYAREHPGIVCLRTQRETLYAAWNRAVGVALGRYIANANTDDRHHPDTMRVMAEWLDASGAGLAYADTLITPAVNETHMDTRSDVVWAMPGYSLRQAVVDCIFGPVTMWRADAHDAIGMFPEEMRIAGDYAFFLHVAWKMGAVHVPLPLGLCHQSMDNLSSDVVGAVRENYAFLPALRRCIPLADMYPFLDGNASDAARCIALVDYANLLLFAPGGHADPAHALDLYAEVDALCPGRFDVRFNAAVAMVKAGERERAMDALRGIDVRDDEERTLVAHNVRLLQRGEPLWKLATVSVSHPLTDALAPLVPRERRRMSRAQYIALRPGGAAYLAGDASADATR
ncbi:glycosyltransferase involved in cell wall biosynthesis [Desulfobaculum xiamenense]|uniref:Glycosyltransferase involved in cell wall biosynthesis n=1 Tax=Desulfobaculum xiamenense TaxID=995050 RepID=A0A846QHQ5_9BACT|nr:glycosyltransferase family 2 protein [Desulfobaculum xiamenense]NJB68376.1 glycosyltransferase involved in cell wall biosynthesis [Desulfobaculum xiamenense]